MTEIIAVVTAGATVIGLYFAFQHHRNEQLKIRLDAYPKRVAIFKCTEEFLGRAWTGNYVHMPALLAEFHGCTKEARFLFDKKLADYLDSLYEGVERRFQLETKLEIEGGSSDFGEKRALQDQVFAACHWLGQENMHLKERFAKYLDLSGLQ
jgi:hypothetical protein